MVIGKTISEIEPMKDYNGDYAIIVFTNGSVLNLNNKTTFSHPYQQFSNETVKNLILTKEILSIKAGDKEITMSMREEDYFCPEAWVFSSQGGKVTIVDS
jgi:hypothetical protein